MTKDQKFRTIIFILLTLGMIWGKTMCSTEGRNDMSSIVQDRLFYITEDFNRFLHVHRDWLRFFQISSSLVMDIAFLSLFFRWIRRTDSLRILFTYSIFYGFRAIAQTLSVLPYPNLPPEECLSSSGVIKIVDDSGNTIPIDCDVGIIWPDPGFPSLVVPYGETSDFLPSGHVGFLVIAMLEWGTPRGYFIHLIAVLYEATVLIATRVHYAVDILFAIILSSWSWMLAKHFCLHYVDNLCAGIAVSPANSINSVLDVQNKKSKANLKYVDVYDCEEDNTSNTSASSKSSKGISVEYV